MSNAETERLTRWASATAPASTLTEGLLAKMLYRGEPEGTIDRLKLSLAAARGRAVQDDQAMIEAGGYSRLLGFAQKWERPEFPVNGNDLAALGVGKGPKVGDMLRGLENAWVDSGFTLQRGALIERAAESLKAAT